MEQGFRVIGGYHRRPHPYLCGSGCLTWRKLENTAYRPDLWAILRVRVRKQRAWISGSARSIGRWTNGRNGANSSPFRGFSLRTNVSCSSARRYDHLPIHLPILSEDYSASRTEPYVDSSLGRENVITRVMIRIDTFTDTFNISHCRLEPAQ